eukprot:scaffold4498_cov119-Isochrysis_galbana.AAC.2
MALSGTTVAATLEAGGPPPNQQGIAAHLAQGQCTTAYLVSSAPSGGAMSALSEFAERKDRAA